MERIEPRPVTSPQARLRAARGTVQQEGHTQSEIMLQAIVILARREQTPTTKAALRLAINRFNFLFGLDY